MLSVLLPFASSFPAYSSTRPKGVQRLDTFYGSVAYFHETHWWPSASPTGHPCPSSIVGKGKVEMDGGWARPILGLIDSKGCTCRRDAESPDFDIADAELLKAEFQPSLLAR